MFNEILEAITVYVTKLIERCNDDLFTYINDEQF